MFYNPKNVTPEQLYRIKRRTLIADIILIILISSLAVYLILNIEHFKTIGSDVCKLCMEKTKAVCFNPTLS